MIYNKRNLLFVFSVMLSLFLVACGGGNGGGGGSVNLSQSFSFDSEVGGSVTISYPEGWFAEQGDGTANFASTEDLLAVAASSDTPEIPEGEVIAVSLFIPAEFASFFTSEGEEPSVTAITNSFTSDLADDESEIGEIEEKTINGSSAATVQGNDDGVDVVLVTIDLGEGNYALVYGATAEGEGDDIRATIEAMAGSVEYTAGESEE